MNLIRSYKNWRRYSQTVRELSRLNARELDDLGIRTKHPIVVTNWTNEEGARFAPAMLASGVFAGVIPLDYAYGRTDMDGKSFGDELKRIGWVGDEEVGAPCHGVRVVASGVKNIGQCLHRCVRDCLWIRCGCGCSASSATGEA